MCSRILDNATPTKNRENTKKEGSVCKSFKMKWLGRNVLLEECREVITIFRSRWSVFWFLPALEPS